MKKFSSFSNKENLYPITKPLSKYSCYRPEKSKEIALVRSKTNRQSNAGIFMSKRCIDFPEISAKKQNKSTRRKVHTQTAESNTARKCKDKFGSIFKREKNESIDKELERLESLHTINRTLRKELDSLETIVLNMSLKRLVRADLQANSQEIHRRRC